MHGFGEKVEGREGLESPDKVKAAADTFGLDFHLDESEKPAPMSAEGRAGACDGDPGGSAPAEGSRGRRRRSSSTSSTCRSTRTRRPSRTRRRRCSTGQWHDAATKLDLAKAYQEMGDVEGAREILQEVLHEGDDEQKKEAQAIIAKLG